MPITIVRPFNTYGPRQSARAIIPTVITQLLSGKSKIKLGHLYPTRDLTYITDTVQGFCEIAISHGLIGEVVNIGMNHEITMLELVKLIAKLRGNEIKIVSDDKRNCPEASEINRLMCNNDKLKRNTNWNPSYNLESGLIKTIEWFKLNMQNYKPEIYNL